MTNSITEQEFIPIWCEDCNCQGYIFIDDPEKPCFVTCETCGWETSQVWCPKCGMGGGFVEEISKHPLSWDCPSCKTQHRLPRNFYKETVALIAEEELSPELRQLISARKSPLNLLKSMFTPTANREDTSVSPEERQRTQLY
jgi:hypothetical protein